MRSAVIIKFKEGDVKTCHHITPLLLVELIRARTKGALEFETYYEETQIDRTWKKIKSLISVIKDWLEKRP